MIDYRYRIDNIANLYKIYDYDMFLYQLRERILDEQFREIFNEIRWTREIKKLGSPIPIELLNMLEILKERIIDYYIEYLKTNREVKEIKDPDLIIGLGCSNGLGFLDKRIEVLGDLVENFPKAKILLSGGGMGVLKTEAREMLEKLKKNYKVDEELVILEEDSLDTLGNIVFSKLLLKKMNMLNGIDKIIVVTSPFHVIRVHSLFSRVFPKKISFEIREHDYYLNKVDSNITTRKIIENEIKSLYRSDGIFNIVNLKEEKKNSFEVDETSIFYQMLLYQDLYKNRRDILRKYYVCLETYKI
ncbi:YdcF family protein [Psychrilyobacter sp.]|uniref:YdcF family protein n=1 Tax=Psychrilyobacter sp. TaxID=2586924 RepID=UPI00301B2FFD